MANENKKDFNAMMKNNKDMPKIQIIKDERTIKKYGGTKMFFAPPIYYNELMKKVPKGKLITISQMRDYLAKENNADFTDPMTAGIFVNIVAWASYQRSTDITPYWRTLKSDGELNAKYPEAIELQKRLLEKEGHTIISKGTKNIKYYVKDFENSLIKLSDGCRCVSKRTVPIDIKIKTWNEEDYGKFIKYLISLQDINYKKFHGSLVLNSKYEMIGIRMPIMREIAKNISKSNIEEFLQYVQDKYYEEVMIQGLIISHIKEENKFYKYFKTFINKIDNWAICDSFCNSIKIIRKHEEKYFKYAIKCALNKEEFISRIGLVMILNHFINKKNLDIIFDILNRIESDKFYINMAEAWLLCETYIKFPKETMSFLKKNKLNKFTQNKAISKIHDSYRISKEEKDLLNNFRR